MEQVKVLEKVIQALSTNFNKEDIADELSFLKIVKDNLKQWSDQ